MNSNTSAKPSLIPELFRLSLTVFLLSWVIARVGLNLVTDALRGADLGLILLSMLVFQAGVILRLSVILSLRVVRKSRLRERQMGLSLALISLAACIIPIGLFFIASFSRPDFDWVLEINFDRALFPALFLLMTLGISTLNGERMPERSGS